MLTMSVAVVQLNGLKNSIEQTIGDDHRYPKHLHLKQIRLICSSKKRQRQHVAAGKWGITSQLIANGFIVAAGPANTLCSPRNGADARRTKQSRSLKRTSSQGRCKSQRRRENLSRCRGRPRCRRRPHRWTCVLLRLTLYRMRRTRNDASNACRECHGDASLKKLPFEAVHRLRNSSSDRYIRGKK